MSLCFAAEESGDELFILIRGHSRKVLIREMDQKFIITTISVGSFALLLKWTNNRSHQHNYNPKLLQGQIFGDQK